MQTLSDSDLLEARKELESGLLRLHLLEDRNLQTGRGGLIEFVRYFWPVLEPKTPLVDGWPLQAICEHLEAVTFGEINRLLINVPPGFCKSLLTDVFWPAWEWSAMGMSHLRYISFSYSVALTERDNGKFRDLLLSAPFQQMYGKRFALRKVGEQLISNDKTGYKRASSVGGIGTGERGDRAIIDDAHNVKEAESEVVRNETVRWFRESVSNRLNDMDKSAIVVIMQRVHEDDVSGIIIDTQDYCHLMIPMEFDPDRACETTIGWIDPREDDSELAWPERFPNHVVESLKRDLGPYAYAAQYAQSPTPRGGAIFMRDWWQVWESDDGRYPIFDFVLASLDPAFTEKEENDPSALTVWGVWTDDIGVRKVMLMDAWRKRLQMHGSRIDQEPAETKVSYIQRTKPEWGLVEWVAHTCRRWKVDRLLVEAKASGITAAQEMERLYGDEQWGVQLMQVKGDKVSRAHAVVPAFSQRLVYAPDREWAAMVIDEAAGFPKGRHDDLVDSMTQGFKHLRDIGLIQHPEERLADETRRSMYRPQPKPLYAV